ncbi:MAG: glutathione S-transferase family protein [Paracoccaceae bacterium]
MYVLHYFPDMASLAVRFVLTELGLPHEARLIDRDGGQLASAGYRALHPLGKVPAIETPDGPMFETAAILLYLADRHAPGQLAPATDSPARAAFLKWLFFTSTNIHPTLMDLFYPERVAGEAASAQVQAHARVRMQDYLAALERAASETPVWLAPDRPSLLGYYIAMLMRWLAWMPADSLAHFRPDAYPALHRVLAQLETQAAVLSVAADESLGATVFTNPAA